MDPFVQRVETRRRQGFQSQPIQPREKPEPRPQTFCTDVPHDGARAQRSSSLHETGRGVLLAVLLLLPMMTRLNNFILRLSSAPLRGSVRARGGPGGREAQGVASMFRLARLHRGDEWCGSEELLGRAGGHLRT